MASFLGGLMAASVLLNVGILLLNLIGLYRVCRKMGEPGWKGLIPIYNMYVLYERLWQRLYFWVYLAATIGMYVSAFFTTQTSPVLRFASTALTVVLLVVKVRLYMNLAQAFGKGRLFAILTLFFEPICFAVLGFGSAVYQERES